MKQSVTKNGLDTNTGELIKILSWVDSNIVTDNLITVAVISAD